MRRSLVLGNWKMHGSKETLTALLSDLREQLSVDSGQADCGIFPPFVYLPLCKGILAKHSASPLALGGQDVSAQGIGAHTGDISAEMLLDVGCTYVLVGHSERRADHNESNEQVAEKYLRAQAAGLTPVLCVGETLAQREAEQTLAVIETQCQAVLQKLAAPEIAKMIIAYEPVWAIGTGKTASAAQAQEVHYFIRGLTASSSARILYGGSVKPDNATELFAQADVDGGLVGGASLNANDFVAIIQAAGKV